MEYEIPPHWVFKASNEQFAIAFLCTVAPVFLDGLSSKYGQRC